MALFIIVNRPFQNYPKRLFQSEAKCEAIDVKMIFIIMHIQTHFLKKGFALSLTVLTI